MKSPMMTAGAITAVSRDLPHGSSLTFWKITICARNFLDSPSGAAIFALIFWTPEAVEQLRRRRPCRHSQRPKLSWRTMFVAPKRKPCRAISSDERRWPCHYLYDDGLITLSMQEVRAVRSRG